MAIEGDGPSQRLFYQRTGTLPVGGEYARMPEEAKGEKDLAGMIASIVDKAMKAKEKK
jgi:phosphoribosylaminoimidazole (AIR) synthetase